MSEEDALEPVTAPGAEAATPGLAATRQLLEQIELDFPEQKLEGLYRFLKAEADRLGGRYEVAIRDYETLARLTQWNGYRDRALYGIADCHFRAGNLDKALEWYAVLKETQPEFFEKQKLADTVKVIAEQQSRIKAGKATAFTEGFTSGLELAETADVGGPQTYSVARGLGIDGPQVGVIDGMVAPVGLSDYSRMFPDLSPEGNYWVEFWYREMLGRFNADIQQQAFAWIAGEGLGDPNTPTNQPLYLERTFGQWRKLAFKIKAPKAADGRLQISIRNFSGVMEIDGITVRPVSDRLSDSLTGFLEGTDAP